MKKTVPMDKSPQRTASGTSRSIRGSAYRLWPLAILLLASWPQTVASQEEADKDAVVIDRLMSCVGVQQEALRLQCYDSLLQPLAKSRVEDASQSASVIRSFAGSDDHDTDVLTIREPWHLRWAFNGSLLSIELRTADGGLVDMVGNQIGAGHGRSAPLQPGVYRLAVRAFGDWQVVLERE
jgi:hypothetical protein